MIPGAVSGNGKGHRPQGPSFPETEARAPVEVSEQGQPGLGHQPSGQDSGNDGGAGSGLEADGGLEEEGGT